MADYRIYLVEPASKHHLGVIEFEADSDEAAVKRMRDSPSWMDRELWNLSRRVLALKRDGSFLSQATERPASQLPDFGAAATETIPTNVASRSIGSAHQPMEQCDSLNIRRAEPSVAYLPPPRGRDASVQKASLPSDPEKRRSARQSFVLILARITIGDRSALCRVRDLSGTGLGIDAALDLKQGEHLVLSFPDYMLKGRVCWSQGRLAGVETLSPFSREALVSAYSTAAIRPRLEHEYLATLCTELRQSVATPQLLPEHQHHRIRQRFSHALRAHLKYEDWAIYPKLLRDPDRVLSGSAARLKAEMGGLEQEFSNYTKRWITNAVVANWAEYRRETIQLVDTLTRRMREEELHLYKHLPCASARKIA